MLTELTEPLLDETAEDPVETLLEDETPEEQDTVEEGANTEEV